MNKQFVQTKTYRWTKYENKIDVQTANWLNKPLPIDYQLNQNIQERHKRDNLHPYGPDFWNSKWKFEFRKKYKLTPCINQKNLQSITMPAELSVNSIENDSSILKEFILVFRPLFSKNQLCFWKLHANNEKLNIDTAHKETFYRTIYMLLVREGSKGMMELSSLSLFLRFDTKNKNQDDWLIGSFKFDSLVYLKFQAIFLNGFFKEFI